MVPDLLYAININRFVFRIPFHIGLSDIGPAVRAMLSIYIKRKNECFNGFSVTGTVFISIFLL